MESSSNEERGRFDRSLHELEARFNAQVFGSQRPSKTTITDYLPENAGFEGICPLERWLTRSVKNLVVIHRKSDSYGKFNA